MTIYVDKECKCHMSDDGTRRAVETEFFDGKCAEFVEGYRCVPSPSGEMIAPWRDYAQLAQCQAIYERMRAQQADMAAQNDALVNDMAQLVEEVYRSDLEMMTE